jgi:hypothetical protein
MTDLPVIEFIEETVAEDGSSRMSFELDEKAKLLCAEFGLRLVVTCAAYGLDIEDAFRVVVDRGEYLKQEPEKEIWDIGE